MGKLDVFKITQAHGYIFQILTAEALCIGHLPKRKNYLLRVLAGGITFLLLAVILPNIITYYVSGLFSATVFFLSLGFWHFCCQADIREILYSDMLALFVQNLSSNVYNLVFYSIFRKNFLFSPTHDVYYTRNRKDLQVKKEKILNT